MSIFAVALTMQKKADIGPTENFLNVGEVAVMFDPTKAAHCDHHTYLRGELKLLVSKNTR